MIQIVNESETRAYKGRAKDTLESFVQYCVDRPELRFWQAVRNWSDFVRVVGIIDVDGQYVETFNFEGRNG